MNKIVITETSKLYRFFKFMRKTPIGMMYINDDTPDSTLNTFNDICTFVRHLLSTVFLAIPIQLLIGVIAIYLVFMGLIFLPLEALYYWFVGFNTDTPIGMGALYGYITIILVYLGLCAIQATVNKASNCEVLTLSEDNPIKTALNIVSQKHSRFCQRLVVKTEYDLRQEEYEKEQKAIQEAEDAAEERRRIFEDAEAEALSNKKESK